jgi:hypothetical protein
MDRAPFSARMLRVGGKHRQVQSLGVSKVAGILCVQGPMKKFLQSYRTDHSGISDEEKKLRQARSEPIPVRPYLPSLSTLTPGRLP